MEASKIDPRFTDVSCDEAVTLYSQYSTQWDAFAHKGSMFDADGDGVPEKVYYNGHTVVASDTGEPTQGEVGAAALTVDRMAETCVQGRGVMVDLRHHLGDDRQSVGYDTLMRIMDEDKVEVETGDMVCLHTGLSQRILDMKRTPDDSIRELCAVLDGFDDKLLQWVTDSPLHEHCLFKLGIHLGELWYLTELATWLRSNNRSRFLLTAPPLRLPGAVGSPATPVATV
jgi:kynurenine formamidase